jgi:putative holliday junction resolvase
MPKTTMDSTEKTVLGFDFGMKHIGVAVGQTITHSASPLTTLLAKDGIPKWDEIKQLIDQFRPQLLIVGIPLNMDGTEQLLTVLARRFMNRLKARFKLPTFAIDERLTTWEAKNHLYFQRKKTKSKSKKDLSHAIAAAILIEQWLHSDLKKE